MYFRNFVLVVLVLLQTSIFAQSGQAVKIKQQKKYYIGSWYASSFVMADKESSSILSPSIEFFQDGTFKFETTLTSYNGKWEIRKNDIIALTYIDHAKNEKTEVYKRISDGLELTDIIEKGHKKSALSLGIKTIYGKSGGKPCAGIPTVVYEGKTYHTVQIGNQCWLKENIDAGTMIKGNQSQTDNGVIEKYCFNDDPKNCNKYGGLYQWNEAMKYANADHTQGICPSGWHIMTKAEYQALAAEVNNNGNILKAQGQGTGNTAGTNTTGFSGLFAGYRKDIGGFSEQGTHSYYWTTAETDSGRVFNMHLGDDTCSVDLYYYTKNDGFSVRCIKN